MVLGTIRYRCVLYTNSDISRTGAYYAVDVGEGCREFFLSNIICVFFLSLSPSLSLSLEDAPI